MLWCVQLPRHLSLIAGLGPGPNYTPNVDHRFFEGMPYTYGAHTNGHRCGKIGRVGAASDSQDRQAEERRSIGDLRHGVKSGRDAASVRDRAVHAQ